MKEALHPCLQSLKELFQFTRRGGFSERHTISFKNEVTRCEVENRHVCGSVFPYSQLAQLLSTLDSQSS
ncbi:hypothetical protein BON30_08855 [Cystobacter ferrugineus]|uniref:Uncharacterized protein n=1 Tax=Cystobacter ferrugineus TaxID=83449 RepID=A0A1L9BFI0_9BACT|nr:hypothetical protein BON30_08855 [Cystobacter ferrugineus]